jgi:ABC-2 type transport system permease protein
MSSYLLKYSFSSWFRVRGGFIGIFVVLAILCAVEGAFWKSVSGAGTVGSYSKEALLCYVYFSLIFYQIVSCIGEPDSLSNKIQTGALDAFLLRPGSTVSQFAAIQLGQSFARTCVLMPLLALVLWNYQDVCPIVGFVSLLCLIPGAALINYFLNSLLSTLTFWFKDSYAFVIFKETLFWIASGALIPLDLFPDQIARIFRALPSAAIGFLPVQVALGRANFCDVLLMQALYLVGLVLLLSFSWNRGVKRYQAFGG